MEVLEEGSEDSSGDRLAPSVQRLMQLNMNKVKAASVDPALPASAPPVPPLRRVTGPTYGYRATDAGYSPSALTAGAGFNWGPGATAAAEQDPTTPKPWMKQSSGAYVPPFKKREPRTKSSSFHVGYGYPAKERNSSSLSSNPDGCYVYYNDFDLDEPFSDSDDDQELRDTVTRRREYRPKLNLPLPRGRIRTLSGTIPPVGYSPLFGGPTMCLACLEFFDLPRQTDDYVEHLLTRHKIVITEIEHIVDLKRYIEHWRHRFASESIEKIFPLIKPTPDSNDPLHEQVDAYYLISEQLREDRQLRERLAMRRLEEVLDCQQRERHDVTFRQTCLYCRYVAKTKAKLVHHLYMTHHMNLGSPDNLVFINEYMELLKTKLDTCQCIYCEKQFPDRQQTMIHMRKRQHREVNPRNRYYDKFYIINYLELGKRWLEVLSEDFEDAAIPTFEDSDEEDEIENWHEWVEPSAGLTGGEEDTSLETMVLCLFCDEAFPCADNLLSTSMRLMA